MNGEVTFNAFVVWLTGKTVDKLSDSKYSELIDEYENTDAWMDASFDFENEGGYHKYIKNHFGIDMTGQ